MSKPSKNWLNEYRDQQALFTAYLECLLLDRERLERILKDQQGFEHARLTALKLLEHLQHHPVLAGLPPPAPPEELSPYELAVHLEYLQRVLGSLASQENPDFNQALHQELAYLLPRLWHPPEDQEQSLKELKERILKYARLFNNQLLLDEVLFAGRDERKSYLHLLRSVDMSLATAWPRQTGLIISKDVAIREQILAMVSVPGLDWLVFDQAHAALQAVSYQDPSLILLTLDESRGSLDKLLNSFPESAVIAIVEDMSGLADSALPLRIDHVLEKTWIERFLPALVHKQLIQRWRDTHQRKRDFLTGLPSLLGIRQHFEHLQELFARIRTPFALAVVDLPGLSQIERENGPYLASEWIKAVARSLSFYLRGSDLVGRWAPDKFILLLPQTSVQGSLTALSRCQQRLEKEAPVPGTLPAGTPVFRAGLTDVRPQIGFEDALHQAFQHLRLAWEPDSAPVQYGSEDLKSPARFHILLLDDDPIVQEMLRFIFAREGYQVTQMNAGHDILEVLEKDPISLLVLDVKMPGMDGFEVLRLIRSRREYDGLPIVMLTSMKGEEDVAKGFELGASDYLYKPFSPTELMIRVKRFLK
ncbi:MAG: response regulator [Candidatus Sericytochromatia bacterium]